MAAVTTTLTVVGTVGRVDELRRVGKENRAVVNFAIAQTFRTRNQNGEWEDKGTLWHNCVAWGRIAENFVASLRVGDRVIVSGTLDVKPAWTRKDGTEAPASPVINVENAGVEISFDPAHSDRVPKGGAAQGQAPQQQRKPAAKAPQKQQADPFGDFSAASSGNDFDFDVPF